MHNAHSIQKGLYARKNTSVQRFPGFGDSHLYSVAATICSLTAHETLQFYYWSQTTDNAGAMGAQPQLGGTHRADP